MAIIKKIKLPNEATARDIGANSSNIIYDGDAGTTTTLNSKIQSIFTAIGDINSFEIALVNALPTENIDDHTIYFVPNSQDASTRDEYMYVGNQWEMIGSTTIDLSDYPTYDDISIVQGLTTGIPAATITVGTTTTTIYTTDGSNHMVKGVDYVTAGKKLGTTLGTKSTAEGSNTTANGSFAHAEGTNTTSSGAATHAEGDSTTAQNTGSHAEGGGTKASGNYSHAEGFFTTANTKSQHVFGEYNILDSGSSSQRGSYVEIVGNGTSSTPSNARTLNWNGNEWLAGKVTVGNITPTAAGDLTSKDYVDTKISTATSTIPAVTPVASLTTGITIGSINVGGTTTVFYAPETNADTLTPTLDTRYLLKQPSALNTFTQATTSNTITVSALDLSRTASIAQETDKIKLSVNQDTLSTAPLSYIQLSAKNDNEYSPGSILTINHTGITINKEPAGTWDVVNKGYVDSKINTVTSTIPTVTPVAALTTGITIGSIDINGVTTTLYAPEDTKVKQNDITGSTTGMRPVLLSAQANHKGTITDESLKSDTLLFYKVLDSLIITRSSSDDFDGRFAVTDSAGKAQAEILSYKEGTTTQTGIGLISAGNNQPSGVAGNAKGALIIYGEGNWQNVVYALDNRTTDDANHNYVNYLPMVDQAVLAAGVTTGVGSSTVPVYMAAGGELLACTLPTPTTYTMSMTGPTINLLADGVAASTITLPIWDGTLD